MKKIIIFLVLLPLLSVHTSIVLADSNLVTNLVGTSKTVLYRADPSLLESCGVDDEDCVIFEPYITELGYRQHIFAKFDSHLMWRVDYLWTIIDEIQLSTLGFPANATGAGDLAAELMGLGYDYRVRVSDPSRSEVLYLVFPSSRVGCEVRFRDYDFNYYRVRCNYPYTKFSALEDYR